MLLAPMTSVERTQRFVVFQRVLVAVCRHARRQDMQLSSATLREICIAGGWRSGAILRYLDQCELEAGVALEAAMQEKDYEWPE